MNPVALRITNFRAFKKTQEFRFAGRPGLFFMQGVNEVEPRLGSNGAAKSTIWDAFTWLFFNKTPKGLKAGDVCNWSAGKGTRIEFDYVSSAGEEITVVRTWGPIKFFAKPTGYDDGTAEQMDLAKSNWVTDVLGVDFEPFLNTVLTAQKPEMFLDMKTGPQAELFSSVMNLDTWLTHSEAASKKASDQDRISRSLEREVAQIEGELRALNVGDLKVSAEAWEVKRADRLQDLAREYEQALDHDDTKNMLAAAEENERNARAYLHSVRVSDDLRRRLNEAHNDLRDHNMSAEFALREAERVEAELDALQADKPCPTCGQRLPKMEHRAAILKANRVAEAARKKTKEWAATIEGSIAQCEALEAEVGAAQIGEDRASRDVEEAADATLAARGAKLAADKYLDRLEDDADRIKREVNPFADMERQQQGRLQDLRDDLAGFTRELDDSERKRSLYAYWVRGFKEIRLGLIGEALTELEIEVNSSCEALGLVGWELNFDVDKETRGGSIQRGFSVTVKSPDSPARVPWESWSGGEAQRLRMAAQCGLADLIRSRTGCTIPLEIWDEPTAGLSVQGVNDLLEALRTRALTEGREIWVVDHRTHAFGGFDGGATVVKTPSGSRVRMSV